MRLARIAWYLVKLTTASSIEWVAGKMMDFAEWLCPLAHPDSKPWERKP
jgi:hypothetical protein